MTVSKNKIKLLIVILIILSVSWANINLFYFEHKHIDENGKIIVHAHPYQKENQKENKQSQNSPIHTHSQSEFIVISLIYKVLSLITFCLIYIIYRLNFNPNLKSHISFHWNHIQYLLKNIFRRGPPFLLQFV